MNTAKAKKPRNALGRGLSALISSSVPTSVVSNDVLQTRTEVPEAENSDNQIHYLPVSQVLPNAKQPRTQFDEKELQELADSIKTLGLIQPILVRRLAAQRYEIIAGERRWRASKLAGLLEIPAVIRDLEDKEVLEVAIVENIQRKALDPIEEALAYQRLMDEFSLTQKEVAERIGKERSTVTNFFRLLSLPEEVREMMQSGQLSMGHAKAILSVKEPSAQVSLAKKVVQEALSVRALEEIVSRVVVLDRGRRGGGEQKDVVAGMSSEFADVLEKLKRALGTKVAINHNAKRGRGKLTVHYYSMEELDRVVEQIIKD